MERMEDKEGATEVTPTTNNIDGNLQNKLYQKITLENQIFFDLGKAKLLKRARVDNVKVGDRLLVVNFGNSKIRSLCIVTDKDEKTKTITFKDNVSELCLDETSFLFWNLYHFDVNTVERRFR